MANTELLNSILDHWKQNIYEALFQAMGEDYQAIRASMDLQTNNSGPFTKWDLAFRNLISFFKRENIPYVISQRGSWSFILVYDEINNIVISFMRKSRYKTLTESHGQKNPQYISELLELNKNLESRQPSLFDEKGNNNNIQISDKLREALNELCINWKERRNNLRHVLVVFDYQSNAIQFLKAYLLDKRMNIIEENNWLEAVKPVISNEISEVTDASVVDNSNVMLNKKSFERIKDKYDSGNQGTANQNTSAINKTEDNSSKRVGTIN